MNFIGEGIVNESELMLFFWLDFLMDVLFYILSEMVEINMGFRGDPIIK